MSSVTPPNSSEYPAPPQAQNVNITNTVVLVNSKSTAVAYILWFLLGNLGVHKFYLRQTGMGVLYLLLGLAGWATAFIIVGYFLLVPLWIMMIIDLFLIPGRVEKLNSRALQHVQQR